MTDKTMHPEVAAEVGERLRRMLLADAEACPLCSTEYTKIYHKATPCPRGGVGKGAHTE